MANTAIFGVKGQCWYMDEYSSFQESLGMPGQVWRYVGLCGGYVGKCGSCGIA